MEKLQVELTVEELNTILLFLDRVEIKGFKELNAMNQILAILQNPKKGNTESTATP